MLKQLILLILLLPTTVFASGVSVFVSVPPLQYLAERIGGNLIMVESMVGPGHNPVSYDPGPGQVHRLADAVLFVRTGIPYEDVWMGRLIQVNPRMQVLDARLNLPVASESVHHHDGHELDPHVWTSLPNAIAIARNIANSLSEFDSGNSSRYRANFDKLEKELEDQHRRIGAMLGDARGSNFMVFHPAWGYFAATYGVNQVAVEEEGKEPGPRKLAQLVERARDSNISAIIVQPQFNTRMAAVIAREIGAEIVEVDPLIHDFQDSLFKVAEAISDGR